MFFFTPRHVKRGRAFLKDAKKLLAYKRDLWSQEARVEFQAGLDKLEAAVRSNQPQAIEEASRTLDTQAGTLIKLPSDAAWRENCEVFLVAIVIALGVRTYFLQPFTIPTGSMQPTLNGIIAYKTSEPPPNIAVRLLQTAWFGRTWVDTVAKTDDVIVNVVEIKTFGFFTKSKIQGQRNTYVVNCPMDKLRVLMGPSLEIKAGQPIARGYYETGDHVFVDKFSYHFRKPSLGDVFVFNTQNIPTVDNAQSDIKGPSQFYIKRLAGTPNDELRIDSPRLYINGQIAQGAPFQRVMSAQNGYNGYAKGPINGFLSSPTQVYRVPGDAYFALGDNSYNSADGRYWGPVPQENIMGRGVLVYWPFGRHWGPIR